MPIDLKFYILDRHTPVPVDLLTWGKWFETAERHLVRDVFDGVEVSTVFLGLDHNYSRKGPPLLFETMVFGGELDQEMLRYPTWQTALAGHREMVERVRATLT
jgi:hypothetical protein